MNEDTTQFEPPPETAQAVPGTGCVIWWEPPPEPQRGPLPTGIKPSRALEDIHRRERQRDKR
jgi:hypothetical protein